MPTTQQVIEQARRSVGTVENATHALSAVSEAPSSGGGLESMGGAGLESVLRHVSRAPVPRWSRAPRSSVPSPKSGVRSWPTASKA